MLSGRVGRELTADVSRTNLQCNWHRLIKAINIVFGAFRVRRFFNFCWLLSEKFEQLVGEKLGCCANDLR